MSRGRGATRRVPLWPWVLLALWVCFIWGQSLLPGYDSSLESGLVVRYVQRLVGRLGIDGATLPLLSQILADEELLHHVVRKLGHFSEYLVLGVLAVNALRLSFRRPLVGALALACLWAGVPYVDETIQRFVPLRSGQLSDMVLDMCGFAAGVVLCLAFVGLVSILRGEDR